MPLTLDTTLLLSEQIALGKYDKADSLIVAGRYHSRFQDAVQGLVSFEWKLFPYAGEGFQKEVELKMGREGFVAADIEFGLAFGAQMPDEQRKSSIILLGAWGYATAGDCFFPYLKGSAVYREVDLFWTNFEGNLYEDKAAPNMQFLGIKRMR